jgi:hypothetical protein
MFETLNVQTKHDQRNHTSGREDSAGSVLKLSMLREVAHTFDVLRNVEDVPRATANGRLVARFSLVGKTKTLASAKEVCKLIASVAQEVKQLTSRRQTGPSRELAVDETEVRKALGDGRIDWAAVLESHATWHGKRVGSDRVRIPSNANGSWHAVLYRTEDTVKVPQEKCKDPSCPYHSEIELLATMKKRSSECKLGIPVAFFRSDKGFIAAVVELVLKENKFEQVYKSVGDWSNWIVRHVFIWFEQNICSDRKFLFVC